TECDIARAPYKFGDNWARGSIGPMRERNRVSQQRGVEFVSKRDVKDTFYVSRRYRYNSSVTRHRSGRASTGYLVSSYVRISRDGLAALSFIATVWQSRTIWARRQGIACMVLRNRA